MSAGPAPVVFSEPFPPAARIGVGAAGALTFLAPYELLIKPGAPLFEAGMIPLWLLAAGALAVGGVFIGAALFGASRTVTVDETAREIRVVLRGLFRARKEERHPFFSIKTVAVIREEDTDGPPRFAVKASVLGQARPMLVVALPDEGKARALAERLRGAIGI